MIMELNPLQELIERRLTELDISQRAACARSQGLLTTATLNRIIRGHHHQITGRTIAGLALALSVPEEKVAAAASETFLPARWDAVASQFGKLSSDRQQLVIETVLSAIEDEEREQRAKLDAERPLRSRRRR